MVDIYISQDAVEKLAPESRFRFSCHAELACFKQCCQNPTIILKPYDIIRLRRRLDVTSTQFLERYTVTVREDRSLLPLVMLDIAGEEGSGCPFLAADGCGVYADRPGACRLFPVVLGSSLGQDGVRDDYFLKRLDFCRGFQEGPEWTLSQWQADQDIDASEALNREWLEIVLKRGAANPMAEDARETALFTMAVYDLDRFRRHIFTTPFLKIHEIPAQVAAILREDDVALLGFGYTYLKMVLRLEEAARMKAKLQELPAAGG